MRRASSSGDDHTNAATSRITGVIGRPVRRPMRRSHVDLVVNSKIVQRFSRLAHDIEIRITTHHDRNQWLAHRSSVGNWKLETTSSPRVPQYPSDNARPRS